MSEKFQLKIKLKSLKGEEHYDSYRCFILRSILLCFSAGADLGFSRGAGADFQKIFQNFDDLFFF